MTETIHTPSSSYKSPLVLSIVTPFDAKLKRNYYLTQTFQGFTWMLFHFSVVFFFGLLLWNILLVWIFLGFANLISLFLDVPIWLIQRYISTKRLFLIAWVAQFIAVGVFFFLIFRFSVLLEYVWGVVTPESFASGVKWFFGNFLNWVGVFIAAICYGVTQEINAVAGYGYVLSHANPSEYSEIFSRSHIAWGVGSVAGLIISWVVLQTPSWLAVIILALVILSLNAFTYQFFNTKHEVIDLEDITAFKASVQHLNMENVKEYLVSTIKKADLWTVVQTAWRYIFLRPQRKEFDKKIPWNTLIWETKMEILVTLNILFQKPYHMSLVWSIGMLLIFGFWDTFATSFLVDFLNIVKEWWSYILLTIIVIPWVLLQTFAWSIANKIGMTYVGAFGLALSGFSLMALGIFSFFSLNPIIILVLAVINSIWYAAGMPMGQNHFLEKYNILYAEHQKLQEIDANASAWPIRMIGNFANVIGLMLWWFILELFHYTWFFLIFGLIILAFLVWVVTKQEHINAT